MRAASRQPPAASNERRAASDEQRAVSKTGESLPGTVSCDLSLHNGHPYNLVSGPTPDCVFPCKDVVDIDGSGQRSGTGGVEVTLRCGHFGARLGDTRMRRPKESNRGRITTDESISIRQKDVREVSDYPTQGSRLGDLREPATQAASGVAHTWHEFPE
jgi:hypothetical protein